MEIHPSQKSIICRRLHHFSEAYEINLQIRILLCQFKWVFTIFISSVKSLRIGAARRDRWTVIGSMIGIVTNWTAYADSNFGYGVSPAFPSCHQHETRIRPLPMRFVSVSRIGTGIRPILAFPCFIGYDSMLNWVITPLPKKIKNRVKKNRVITPFALSLHLLLGNLPSPTRLLESLIHAPHFKLCTTNNNKTCIN